MLRPQRQIPSAGDRPSLLRQNGRLATTDHGPSERSLESRGLWAAVLAFVLSALVALLVFRLTSAPIAGEGSVGQFAAISSAVAAVAAFVGGRIVVRAAAGTKAVGFLDVVDVAAFAFANAMIALFGWSIVATILELSFIDAVVFPLPVLVLSGSAAAVTAYLAFAAATHVDLQLLAVVLAVFLVLGIIVSALTAQDPHWWKDNLSALGMTNDLSARTFNLTLIVAGVVVTTLARSATQGIPSSSGRGIAAVRTCLVVVGILLSLVGVFPVDRFFALHTAVASGMTVAFAVLVIGLRSWIPDSPRTFLSLGYAFIAAIVALAVCFAIGYYTLTAVELVAGILVFTWIVLFVRNVDAMARDTAESSGD
jgi:hypothetical membrane protein